MHYDEHHGKGQFLWTHTTASMGIAYQTTSDETATTIMSRIPNSNQNPGKLKQKKEFKFSDLTLSLPVF